MQIYSICEKAVKHIYYLHIYNYSPTLSDGSIVNIVVTGY